MLYNQTAQEVEIELNTSIENGLSSAEAHNRLLLYGQNILNTGKKKGKLSKFLGQFKDFMVILLLIAAIISVVASGKRGIIDAIVILVVVGINAAIGFIQQMKVEKTIESFQEKSNPVAKVKRDGTMTKINSALLVRGDIIYLEAGDCVPADARIVECINLKVDESALTGESVPIEKNSDRISEENVDFKDRVNMLARGTIITYGSALAIVVSTGMNSEIGKIAKALENVKAPKSPLDKKVSEIAKVLGAAAIGICILIFIIGIARKKEIAEMFMLAVSLAVAAMPEVLRTVVVLAVAMGVKKIENRNVIVKNLQVVERLGSTGVICSDKTGTLTQNVMELVEISATNSENANFCLELASLCSDVYFTAEKKAEGDAVEVAFVNAALEMGINKAEIDEKYPRVAQIPFDGVRKLMTTIHKTETGYRVITKGAPEVLMKACCEADTGEKVPMTAQLLDKIYENNYSMAQKALKVIAVAYKDIDVLPNVIDSSIEANLTFVALAGMIDPPREDVKKTVELCKKAGIKPIMITGDYKETAVAVAKELGIFKEKDMAISGAEIDEMSMYELIDNVDKYSVFANVSPENKVRIIQAWQRKGQVIMMIGDNVNDTTALKCADISCVDINADDAVKNGADMILSDDNFSEAVSLIEEGRRIFENIKKSVAFLISSNIGEMLTIFIAMVIGKNSPLIATQLLFINLVTDSFPSLALGYESQEENIMRKNPWNIKKSFFTDGMVLNSLWQGALISIVTLMAYSIGENSGVAQAGTMAFAVLSFSQLFHAFDIRSEYPILRKGLFSNKQMILAFIISAILQVAVLTVPVLQGIFHTISLSTLQWMQVLLLSISTFIICEVVKTIKYYRNGR